MHKDIGMAFRHGKSHGLQVAGYAPPNWTVLGKPNTEPFRMAEQLLSQQAERMHSDGASSSKPSFDAIYMVGDNPEADILGAKNAGTIVHLAVEVRDLDWNGNKHREASESHCRVTMEVHPSADRCFQQSSGQLLSDTR